MNITVKADNETPPPPANNSLTWELSDFRLAQDKKGITARVVTANESSYGNPFSDQEMEKIKQPHTLVILICTPFTGHNQ